MSERIAPEPIRPPAESRLRAALRFGVIGLALLGGGFGQELLKVAGYVWPLILVGIGIYLLLRRRVDK